MDSKKLIEDIKRKKGIYPKCPESVWSKWTADDINIKAPHGIPTEKEIKEIEEAKKKVYARRTGKMKREEQERQDKWNNRKTILKRKRCIMSRITDMCKYILTMRESIEENEDYFRAYSLLHQGERIYKEDIVSVIKLLLEVSEELKKRYNC